MNMEVGGSNISLGDNRSRLIRSFVNGNSRCFARILKINEQLGRVHE